MSGRRRTRDAFTLVELLVVIGIIAVLLGILLPSLSKARAQAQQVVCEAHLRQFGMGIQIYADQNRNKLPQEGPDGSDASKNSFSPAGGVAGVDDPSLWFNAIPTALLGTSYYDMIVKGTAPHWGNNSIFICPSAGQPASLTGEPISADGNYFLLYGTDTQNFIKTGNFPFGASYVWNSKLNKSIAGNGPPGVNITRLRPGSACVIMVEKISYPGEYQNPAVQLWNSQYPSVYNGKITAQGLNNKFGQPKADWTRFAARHNNGGHLLFIDGHVALYPWTAVQIPASQMPYSSKTSDANQYGEIVWSTLGPVN